MEIMAANPWMILPFGVLLGLMALGPLLFPDWWTKNYVKAALFLAGITLAYYFFGVSENYRHAAHERLRETAQDYIKFIALIGSLFVVSGGIHINVKGEATPLVNVLFLFIGALLANILGTTGASMLLIRPWLRMNKFRVTAHHVVFFIFIVSNVGGCLTPVGDPPLFLGYLKGIPFWWVAEHCWPMWALGLGILLAMFFWVDRRNYLRAPKVVREKLTEHEDWRFDGLGNLFFLAIILGAVFINNPPFIREGLMLAAAAGSYFSTRKSVYKSNHFNFHPITEVAILFIGIFATMMPALDWLQGNAPTLMGQNPPASFFYWSCGLLSSALDNAPTYLSFLSAIFGSFVDADVIAQVHNLIQSGGTAAISGTHAVEISQTFSALKQFHAAQLVSKNITTEEIEIAFLIGNLAFNKYLVAVSIGAVFFGANTYIGNGPNFLVKAIADHHKIHTPGFLGYIFKFTLPCMLPMLLLVWWIFFR
ncbi:MAG: sodium:proton antiporter [Verrucomicrobiota bacterium]|nr:sodium:proton antiporter [Verrucomicrobiota bacterium]